MTNVVQFPRRSSPYDPGAARVWIDHERRVHEAIGRLEKTLRGISQADRWTMCRNLGDLLQERARAHGMDRGAALVKLWSDFDPHGLNWAKRLRYLRFSDDSTKADTLAGTGQHYVKLARHIDRLLPAKGVSFERSEIEALSCLLRGSHFDADPTAKARVDFDLARDLGELIGTAVEKLQFSMPPLSEYFRRLEAHGLRHSTDETPAEDDLAARPMRPLEYFRWNIESFDLPAADAVQSRLVLTASHMQEGFWFEDLEGLETLLPRIVLGRITTRTRTPCIPESHLFQGGEEIIGRTNEDAATDVRLSDTELAATVASDPELMALLARQPRHLPEEFVWEHVGRAEVQLVLVPSEGGQIRAGLIVRQIWSLLAGENWMPPVMFDGTCAVVARMSDQSRCVILHRTSPTTLLSPGTLCDSLFLIPGAAAEHVLGLRQTAADYDFHGHALSHATEIEPNFEVPAEFTPHAGTSLGGMLLRNLLYAARGESIFEALAADARARIDRLERQHGQWQRQYEAARAAFLSSPTTDEH